jgi:hypothetical protein
LGQAAASIRKPSVSEATARLDAHLRLLVILRLAMFLPFVLFVSPLAVLLFLPLAC